MAYAVFWSYCCLKQTLVNFGLIATHFSMYVLVAPVI